MSTLKVVNVQHPSASEPSITLDSDGGMSGGFPSPNRNLLYNGAMQVHQRGASATGITLTGYQTADRWLQSIATLGTWTHSIENDAPTGSGFRKSLRLLCTTADSSPAAGDVNLVAQLLEGQDLQRIFKGTSSAQQLTVSFWVKSNVTGTYVVRLSDIDNGRSVSATYSISASATWERQTITFPADTTGVLDNDNSASFSLQFWLGAGSNFRSGTLATSWAANTDANAAVGQTNLAAATNNYWQITGVQLEVGPVATSFEFKSYGQELRECQRYYQEMNFGTIAGARWTTKDWVGGYPFFTRMRAAASISFGGNVSVYANVSIQDNITPTTWTDPTDSFGSIRVIGSTVADQDAAIIVRQGDSTGIEIRAAAEL